MNLTKGSFSYKMNDTNRRITHMAKELEGRDRAETGTTAGHCTLGRQPRGPQGRDAGKDVREV